MESSLQVKISSPARTVSIKPEPEDHLNQEPVDHLKQESETHLDLSKFQALCISINNVNTSIHGPVMSSI